MKTRANRLAILSLLAGLCLFVSACDMKLPPMPWDPPPKADPHATEEPPAEPEEPEPVDLSVLLPPAMRVLPVEEVTIDLKDGLQLAGKLYDPSLQKDENGDTIVPAAEAEEYTGPRFPLVILIHGLNHTQADWQAMPATLVRSGYAVFAMDVRGHGQSTRMSRKRRVNWRMLSNKQWTTVHQDVKQAVDFFQKGEDYPQIDGNRVALVAERFGGAIAAMAAKPDTRVKALVLLTPTEIMKGLDTAQSLRYYTRPTMFIANDDEKEQLAEAEHLYGWTAAETKVLQIYKGKGLGSGVDMISRQTIEQDIINWLRKQFPNTETTAAPVAETEPAPDEAKTPAEEKSDHSKDG